MRVALRADVVSYRRRGAALCDVHAVTLGSRLHAIHGEGAGSATPGLQASERPCAADGVVVQCSLHAEGVIPGGAGRGALNVQRETTSHTAVEVATCRKRASRCGSICETAVIRRECDISSRNAVVAVRRERCGKREYRSIALVE